MGKKDKTTKNIMQNNEYFADTVNNVLFHGEKVVKPGELKELDPTELVFMEKEENDSLVVERVRDVLKQATIWTDDKMIYVIFGIENQTQIHYAMPVKCLLYDAMRYAKQVDVKDAEHRKNRKEKPKLEKNTSGAEFLSGWKREDKLIPVVTLTVYYGAEEWDGPRSIHDMMGKEVEESLLDVIPNYTINLLEPAKIEDFDKFETDIGLLFQFISISNQKGQVRKLVNDNKERYSSVDNKIVNAINFYTKSNFKVDPGGEETCV